MEQYPRQRERVLTQRAADTVVLLDLDDGEYFTLDEVGGRIWELCDGSHSVSQMVAILSQEYDASPAAIQADVAELLTDLADEKLVVYTG